MERLDELAERVSRSIGSVPLERDLLGIAQDLARSLYATQARCNELTAEKEALRMQLQTAATQRVNLIAQRDDLLATLRAIEARIGGGWDNAYLQMQGPLGTVQDDCLAYARAGIAKAAP